MKKLIKALFIAAIFIVLFSKSTALAGKITVIVTNIKVLKGVIRIALYNQKETFPKEGEEYRSAVVQVKSAEATYMFSSIPQGWYAIALYHDINNDGKCNRNLIDIPVEPFGFSRNVKVKLSAPHFDECSFFVDDDANLTIRLYKK